MKMILLVKTSSLGDVIHNLPVATDLRARMPGIRIDWAVEETFAAVPRLHPAVGTVYPVALRRWRRSLLTAATRAEIAGFVRGLRRQAYDAVLDTQGLLKSALVAFAARGERHGLDWASAREPLFPFYDRTYAVSWDAHAVQRNRALAGKALGYAPPDAVDYGISVSPGAFEWLPRATAYAVLLHGTSRERKLWPEPEWTALGRGLAQRGWLSVLPWAGAGERARSERLAQAIPGAIVPPELALAEVAGLIAGAAAVAGVDTGLAHLAGALGKPTVGIYVATDPAATGLFGCRRAANLGGVGAAPAAREALAALERLAG